MKSILNVNNDYLRHNQSSVSESFSQSINDRTRTGNFDPGVGSVVEQEDVVGLQVAVADSAVQECHPAQHLLPRPNSAVKQRRPGRCCRRRRRRYPRRRRRCCC